MTITVAVAGLRHKEVINICDGKRLGVLRSVELDWEEGRIISIVVPSGGLLGGLISKNAEYVIPWQEIRRIGDDTILVEHVVATPPGKEKGESCIKL